MPKSAYIHIPFCTNICAYCDFPKLYYNKHFISNYLKSLEREIKSTYKGEVLDTLYIGGGTPSALSLSNLKELFKILSIFKISDTTEVSIEGNFDTTTPSKLDLYKEFGINRLSFGLESIDKNNLSLLERNTSPNQVRKVVNYSKSIGLNNINVDLIYAIPKETIEVLEKDLDFILSLDIPHISTYSLIIENNTKLSINNIESIDEDLDYKMYKTICNKLKNNNYIHYEISNFARIGYESHHNTIYWNNDEYYGFGLGAASFIGNTRINNTKSINKYLKGEYIYNKEELSIDDKMEYEIILNLRKKEGINLDNFKRKYGKELIEVYNYKDLVEKKLLVKTKNNLNINEDKWYISNEIIVMLMERVVK